MDSAVDLYFVDGCGRCPLGGTPSCKVQTWTEPMKQLRLILLDCGLTETLKWGVPCYMFQGQNLLLLSAFNAYCSLSFFKGLLLQDAKGLLASPGENSQAVRLLKFTSSQEVIEMTPLIKAYIFEAIEIEKAGLKVDFKEKDELVLPEELLAKMDEHPELKIAFEALTPGRQRGYILNFTQPKQSKTRIARIEKWIPKILEGKGIHDDYRKKK
ncbi:MAG: YdeI family protein [Bacteroidia bacterium]